DRSVRIAFDQPGDRKGAECKRLWPEDRPIVHPLPSGPGDAGENGDATDQVDLITPFTARPHRLRIRRHAKQPEREHREHEEEHHGGDVMYDAIPGRPQFRATNPSGTLVGNNAKPSAALA